MAWFAQIPVLKHCFCWFTARFAKLLGDIKLVQSTTISSMLAFRLVPSARCCDKHAAHMPFRVTYECLVTGHTYVVHLLSLFSVPGSMLARSPTAHRTIVNSSRTVHHLLLLGVEHCLEPNTTLLHHINGSYDARIQQPYSGVSLRWL